MLEILRNQFKDNMTAEEKISHLREFLQVLILKTIYDLGYFKNLIFTGETALRLFFDLQRFSEDLDFSLGEKTGYKFNDFISRLKNQLKRWGLNIEIKKQEKKIVQSAMIKFEDILFQLGLSNIPPQKLFVRIEIDTNPPEGWGIQISLLSKTYVFTIPHFELSSLFATKLHACFYRKYTKGRDIYDFIWYLGKNMLPNFTVLNEAILQTEKKDPGINRDNFKDFLVEKVAKIDFQKARKDVERFLIDKNELKLFDKKLIQQIILDRYKI